MSTSSPGSVDPGAFLEAGFPLPSLSPSLERLRQALGSGPVDVGEVASIFSDEPRLVDRTMKIVNSPCYGLPSTIRDLRHAVAYLGADEIERVAMVVAVMDRLAPDDTGQFDRFWFHAFHTALSARAICKNFARSVDPRQLFSEALLHDVGKLVYLKFFPERYDELARHCVSRFAMMVDAEEELGVTSHISLGTTLAERWSLPASVKRACGLHELRDLKRLNDRTPENGDDLKVLCSANLLSNLSTGELGTETKTEIRDEVLRALDCNEGGFLLLMGELYELKSVVQRLLTGF